MIFPCQTAFAPESDTTKTYKVSPKNGIRPKQVYQIPWYVRYQNAVAANQCPNPQVNQYVDTRFSISVVQQIQIQQKRKQNSSKLSGISLRNRSRHRQLRCSLLIQLRKQHRKIGSFYPDGSTWTWKQLFKPNEHPLLAMDPSFDLCRVSDDSSTNTHCGLDLRRSLPWEQIFLWNPYRRTIEYPTWKRR